MPEKCEGILTLKTNRRPFCLRYSACQLGAKYPLNPLSFHSRAQGTRAGEERGRQVRPLKVLAPEGIHDPFQATILRAGINGLHCKLITRENWKSKCIMPKEAPRFIREGEIHPSYIAADILRHFFVREGSRRIITLLPNWFKESHFGLNQSEGV